MLSEREKILCINIVREAIAKKINLLDKMSPCPNEKVFSDFFGLFVTLEKRGRLRGCIGYIIPHKSLYETLLDLAIAAAFKDNRFDPVTKEEFDELCVEISILSPLYEITDKSEVFVGRDGLYIQHPKGSGLLLPQVATKYNWDRDTFFKETCRKAGLAESLLFDKQMKIYRFEAEIFSEK